MNIMKFTKPLSAIVLAFVGFVLCASAQGQRTATAVPTVVNGFVVSITVTDGGSGYTAAPTITISEGGGSGAIAVATINNGAVNQIIVTDSGSKYTGTPTVLISAPPSSRTATATASVVNGFVVSITVTDGGSGYTDVPTVTISGGNGSGASAVATISDGAVNQIIVQNAGKGYPSTPTVTISPPPSGKPPFSDGLVAYFPFNGNANDESGNGINGTVHGATLTKDRFGNANHAYLFGGSSAYITAPFNSAVFGGDFTASVWFNAEDLIGGWPTLLYEQSSGESLSFGLSISGSACGCDAPGFLIAQSSYAAASFSYLLVRRQQTPTRTYCQVVVTKAGANVTMYLNSEVAVTGLVSNPIKVSASTLWIGRAEQEDVPGGYVFHGTLDDIRLYNRALSAQEVEDLYYYEAPEQPWLTIDVKTVQITMHVKPTKKYQLEASLDLKTWAKVGEVFLASSSAVTQEFNAVEVGRYFRLQEVQ